MYIKLLYLFLVINILLNFTSCNPIVKSPNKISRLSMLSTQKVDDKVEFTVWVSEVAGDEKLGLELVSSDAPNSYPMAIITLKDGQKSPEKEKQLCIRGQLARRDEVSGNVIYRIKEGEVIDCY
ncbi:MAG: hypothetical protein WAQ98_14305 [Blastocatellia bacterium]